MAQGRMLQKRISVSDKMPKLSTDGARLLYTWTLAHLDYNGCYYADPMTVRNLVFTKLNHSIDTVANYLDEIEKTGAIVRYKVDGQLYQWWPDFFEKQPYLRQNKEAESDIPVPPATLLQHYSNITPDHFRHKVKEGKVREGKIKESKPDIHFDEIWNKYPNKIGKKQAEKHFKITVRSEKEWKDINTALDNYVQSKRVKSGFVQNGSTWFNNWADWIEYVEPGELTKAQRDQQTEDRIKKVKSHE